MAKIRNSLSQFPRPPSFLYALLTQITQNILYRFKEAIPRDRMVVFVAHTAVNACNTGNERKSDVVNCGATCIMIEHFAKGEEVDMVEKILSIIAKG